MSNFNLNFKSDVYEIPLDDLPSDLDVALNGSRENSNALKSAAATTPHLLDPDAFRRLSVSTISGLSDDGGRGRGRSPSQIPSSRHTSQSPELSRGWKAVLQRFWQRNRGLWLVALSQLFGALMSVTTRLLELEGDGMNPLQILLVRWGITMVLCCSYMWYTRVPTFPFGAKEVRWLLVARGTFGFISNFGLFYSLQYLPIAEATVIGFLAPSVAGYACYLLVGELFTRTEQVASLVSFIGVVLIARPSSFFSSGGGSSVAFPGNSTIVDIDPRDFPDVSGSQRLSAIAMSLLGVFGAAGAFTCVRWIGKRAHPLISVNYFAVLSTLVSSSVLCVSTFSPEGTVFHSETVTFALPSGWKQWFLLLFLGSAGFIMQYMLTSGLAHEKGNRATNMIYTNMLFALIFDRWVFGTVLGGWSWVGSALILGSAVFVTVQKGAEVREVPQVERDEEESVFVGQHEEARETMSEAEGEILLASDELDDTDENRNTNIDRLA